MGPSPSSERIDAMVRDSDKEQDLSEYKTEVNALLANVLNEANARDADATNRHLETVRGALEGLIEDSIELRFGGSVSKHTYVDGISDVDVLAVLKRQIAQGESPKALIEYFASALRSRLPNTEIKTGAMSVTLHFADGIDIQVLPAFPEKDGYRLPRYRGDTWSGVVKPKEFATRLTSINQANGGNVVRAIKLYKIAQEGLPEHSKLAGYHIESIAVEAFSGYAGPLELREMFMHLARASSERVKYPMEETTGQSTYADAHLGIAGSAQRMRTSDTIKRMVTRFEVANDQYRLDTWKEAF